jgi:hypothetical protein
MSTFQEGQEVEVCADIRWRARGRKAKILTVSPEGMQPETASVIFPDGTRAVFDAEHIREVSP